MKSYAVVLIITMSLGTAAKAAEPDYWLVNYTEDNYLYLDASTIKKTSGFESTVWVKAVNENQKQKLALSMVMYQYKINCNQDTTSQLYGIVYDGKGQVATSSATPYAPASPIVPGSIGEAEENIVCGKISTAELMKSNVHFGNVDVLKLSDAAYANHNWDGTEKAKSK